MSSTTSLQPTKIDPHRLEALGRVWQSVQNARVKKEGKGILTLDERDAYADIRDCVLKGIKYKDVVS
jgi:hypothetical protein